MVRVRDDTRNKHGLPTEDYDAADRSMSDDLDLLDRDCVLLDKGELVSYTIGAIVAAALAGSKRKQGSSCHPANL